MDRAVVMSLARLPSLSADQLRGVITAVAQLEPTLLMEVAARSDLDDELRRHLLREAPTYRVVDLLNMWPPDRHLALTAADADEALPAVIAFCGTHGWTDLATELVSRLSWQNVHQTMHQWSSTVSSEIPRAILIALIHTALTNREPRPDLSAMSEWERQRELERMSQEATTRSDIAWSLLEQDPALWEPLARGGENTNSIRRILLERPDELTDEALTACLPVVLGEQLAGKDFMTDIRLISAARHVRRRLRLRQIAQAELSNLISEVVRDGWTPNSHFGRPDLDAIAALAELSDDTQLLTAAVAAIQQATPAPSDRDREHLDAWSEQRAATVVALASSPHVPRGDLIALLPTLDERALEAILQHSDGELNHACSEQLVRLRQAAEAHRPAIVPVPDDEDLAQSDDPAAVLRSHLRYLKGRADQRKATIAGLLESQFATPEILRALPAAHVLGSSDQADQIAGLLAKACAEDEERWNGLAALSRPAPARAVTFGAWLDQLAAG